MASEVVHFVLGSSPHTCWALQGTYLSKGQQGGRSGTRRRRRERGTMCSEQVSSPPHNPNTHFLFLSLRGCLVVHECVKHLFKLGAFTDTRGRGETTGSLDTLKGWLLSTKLAPSPSLPSANKPHGQAAGAEWSSKRKNEARISRAAHATVSLPSVHESRLTVDTHRHPGWWPLGTHW